jgi:hypothetical protein
MPGKKDKRKNPKSAIEIDSPQEGEVLKSAAFPDGEDTARALASNEFQREASATQVQASDLSYQLVAYWPFDEGQGGIAYDASGTGNHGKLMWWPGWVSYGRFGSALRFVPDLARNVFVENPSQLTMTNEVTLSFWIFPERDKYIEQYGGAIIDKFGEYTIEMLSDGRIWGNFASSRPGPAGFDTGCVAAEGTWTHIAVVYQNGISGQPENAIIKVYKNGQELPSIPASGALISNQAGNELRIGAARGAEMFERTFMGLIDEVRVYRRALNAAEVQALFQGPNGIVPGQQVAHWKLDDGQGAIANDASGHNHVADLRGATWEQKGIKGGALNFNSVNKDYAQVRTPSPFIMTTTMTICAWIKPLGEGTPGIGGVIICKEFEYILARWGDGSIRFAFANNSPGWGWHNTGYIAPLDQWTHIALVYDKGAVKMYANGKEVTFPVPYTGVGAIGSFNARINDLRIGGRQFTPQHFHGLIDEVHIFNYALTAAEIAAIVPPPNQLVAHWKFDEGSGTTAADATGNGNTGEVNGPQWTKSRFGSALSFDGVDDYVQIKTPSNFVMTEAMSACAWIYPQGEGSDKYYGGIIVNKEGEYLIARFADGSIQWAFNSKPEFKWINTGYIAPLNQWTHIAVVYDNGTVRTYANGQEVLPSFAMSGPIISSGIDDVRIGGRKNYNQHFHGLIDEVRLYNYALSADKIAELIPPLPALLARWTFDEVIEGTVADMTGNGNLGEVKGAVLASGRMGKALSFDGDDYVEVKHTPLLEIGKDNSDFSVAFHVLLREGGSAQKRTLMHKGGTQDECAFGLGLEANSKQIGFRINQDNGASKTEIKSDIWTAVALVKAGDKIRLYIDGVQDQEIPLTAKATSNSGPLYIGKDPWNSGLNGCLDEARIYSYALTADQVKALAQPPQLVAHWKLDEGKGTTIEDAALNGHDGKLTGPTWAWIPALYDRGLSFGGNDYVRIENSPMLGEIGKDDGDFSVTFHLFLRQGFTGNWRFIMHKGTEDLDRTFSLWLHPYDNRIAYGISTTTNRIAGKSSQAQITLNTWTAIAFIKSGRRLQLYLNGKLDSELLLPDPSKSNEGPLYIGKDPWYPGLNGCLDNIRLYNYALSVAEIEKLAQPPKFTPEALYRLEAYHALLAQSGTSYVEIRQARGADQDFRKKLADKLGIDSDHLEKLFLLPEPEAITEKALEEIFGLMDTTRNPLQEAKKPLLLNWRLEHLRRLWLELDWPTDPFREGARPIIDPDVIGPDDLRKPEAGNAPFDLWKIRREWVDARLQEFMNMKKTVNDETAPDLATMFGRMYQEIAYADAKVVAWKNTQPADFDQLANALQGDESEAREQALAKIKNDLRLTVESFTRLLAIRDKDLATSDPRNEKVSDEEWQEIYSILTQAQKLAVFSKWMEEERTPDIFFGPKSFWISMREPKEGDWPSVLLSGHPMIDPDLLKLDDLPESRVGKVAKALWEKRRLSLVKIPKDLKQERETNGFEAMLRFALGHPNPGDPLQHDLDALKNDLNNVDPNVVESAKQKITNDLHLKVEAFNRLMLIRAKDAQADPFKKPTAAEYAEVCNMLTPGRKLKHEYPVWIAEEQNKGLQYWNCLKARLPRWRAGAEARQQWQQALRLRSRPPIIDPDVVGRKDLRHAVPGNPAFDIWRERVYWVNDEFNSLQQQREEQDTALAGFDKIVADTLAMPIAEVLDLAERNEDIAPVLEQLHVSKEAFRFLLRMRPLLATEGVPLTEAEWIQVYNLLVQIKKSLKFAEWQEVERQRQLALVPEHFQLSDEATELPLWRATPQARQDWQDTLQARRDQEQTVEDALAAAVDAVEVKTLPMLRDALVRWISALQGKDEAAAGDWLSEQLAIEVRSGSSQKTTRLLQAIASVQGVLFFLRTGRFVNHHPVDSWVLAVDEGHFDLEWKWMGAYEAWASGMLAFYYPEHLLIPSLFQPNRPKDDAFSTLLKKLRTNAQLTPDQARKEAEDYAKAIKNSLPNDIKDNEKHFNLFITEQLSTADLATRRNLIRGAYGNITDPHKLPSVLQELFYFVPLQLALQLQKAGQYVAALGWFRTIFAYNLADKPETPTSDERKIYYDLELERNDSLGILDRGPHWAQGELDPHGLASIRTNPYTRYTILAIARCFLDFGDAEFTLDTFDSLARARGLYDNARRLLLISELQPPPFDPTSDVIPPNPVQEMLRLRVELQLAKLRDGRNIAGMKRQVDLLTSISGLSYLPTIGSNGQLNIPGLRSRLRPTPYRFAVLLERSKQLVNLAQQIEAAYLAALEKLDVESYNLLKAGHDLQLAQSQQELQNRRVEEANLGVNLAQAQRQRAVVVKDKYTEMSSLPLNQYEEWMIQKYNDAIGNIQKAGSASALAAKLKAAATLAHSTAFYLSAIGQGVGAWIPGFTPVKDFAAQAQHFAAAGLHMAASASEFAAGLQEGYAASYSAHAQVDQVEASIAGIRASHEWRKKEWELQAAIAEQDIAIGNAQVAVAQAQVQVVEQERRIAQMQISQAQAALAFLANKFTNAELYEWMSGILGDVYRYFLQQATAMAQLAENQLWFERQETPPRLIQANYWQTSGNGVVDQKSPDRRGLTGSARLLQDITQLDLYAFKTDKRKLNLSQTFSLARLSPYEFEQFRENGVLTFNTPMSIFDREFPGHYLRLIKRLRVAVVALVPPHHGIRATLTASGISRVAIGGDVFQEVVIRRDPELIAFTSPVGSTGVFELDPQAEMLLPFESMGVDTFWQFEMPKAANQFDFRTIADVLVTIEYTALHSFDYRQIVIKKLPPKLSGERSFSFRSEFSDAWYDLHNPEQSATPLKVKFKIDREDFPPNLDNLKIEHVLLFFSRAEKESFEIEIDDLRLTPKGETQRIGGRATTIDGMVSTRHGNGSAWGDMNRYSPGGEWELALQDSEEVRGWFKDGKINDILLVITYGGHTPAWPGLD